MKRRGNIVRYTAEEIDAMTARGEDQTDWAAVDAKTEEQLEADIASDPDWADIPRDWVLHARLVTGALARPAANKRQVTVRLDPDVLDFFRAQGRGWQGRINAVLRSYMERAGASAEKDG
jgi:uncharacterized protein (DUF4415 family)